MELLCAEEMAPIDIHQHFVNIYGDQTLDVSTMRQWVVCFSGGNSDVNDSHIPDGHTDFYGHGMQALVHRWQKCVTNGGAYVENSVL